MSWSVLPSSSKHSIHSVHTMLQYVLECTTLIFQTFYTLCSYHAPICPGVYYAHLPNILYTLFIPCSNMSWSVLPSSSKHSIHSVHTMLQYVLECTTLIFQTFYTLCSYHAPICPGVYYPHLPNILYTLFIPCSNMSWSVLRSSSKHSIHSVHTMLQYVLECTTLIFQTLYTLCSYHAPICSEVYYPHLAAIYP